MHVALPLMHSETCIISITLRFMRDFNVIDTSLHRFCLVMLSVMKNPRNNLLVCFLQYLSTKQLLANTAAKISTDGKSIAVERQHANAGKP